MTVPGCDVSQFQSTFDTKKYKFVYVRTGFGTSIPLDSMHATHVKRARAANMLVGHYHFLRPGSIAQQAKTFVQNSGAKAGEFLVCDWETYDGTAPTTSEKDQFIKAVQKLAPNNKVLLYCNLNFWNSVDTSGFKGDGLAIADYTTSTKAPVSDWVIWQYSEDGGLDKDRGNFSSITPMKKFFAASAPVAKPTPAPAVTPAKVISETVDGEPLGKYKTSGTKFVWRPLYHNNNVQATKTCYCVTKAIAMAEAMLIKQGVIKESLDFWQFGYGQAAAASADTHAAGGVVDTVQIDEKTQKVLRQVGFTASWYRGPGSKYGNFSTEHIHAVLSGCPHVSAGAKAQTKSVRAGGNGLADNAADYGDSDVKYITWQDAWKKFVVTETNTVNGSDNSNVTNTGDTVATNIHFSNSSLLQTVKAVNTYVPLQYKKGTYALYSDNKAYTVQGTINLVVSGLAAGDTLMFRTVAYDYSADGKTQKRQGANVVSEIHGIDSTYQWGPSVPFIHAVGAPAKGFATRRLRVEWAATNKDVVVHQVDINGFVS